MPKRALERQIEALEALRGLPYGETSRSLVRKALADRSNYVVARAAMIVAHVRAEELVPELVAAFERFMVEPVKSDPQCLAKTALAKALRDLSYHRPEVYVRGIVHVQMEPTWGGRADTAGALRGTCALALSECPLDDLEILTYLADALADPDKVVRIDSAMAITQLGRREGALPLRVKLLLGDVDADVMGHCFAALLSVSPEGGVAFVARFLDSDNDDVQLEAASALAQCRDPRAIEILAEYWQRPLLRLDVQRALLISLGASPVPESAELLLGVVAHDSPELAKSAITALAASRFLPKLRDRLAATVAARRDPDLQATLEQIV